MAEKSRGQKIAEAQRSNAQARTFLAEMNSIQINNFVRKLDARTVKRLRKALAAYDNKAAVIRKKQIAKEMKKLQAELAKLD